MRTTLLLATLCTLAATAPRAGAQNGAPSLVERLGYPPDARVLIVNGDDVGMSYASNAATIDAMENGLMTSGTIMVPCPWFAHIASYAREHPEADFGLHLTHTSEWKHYRWGPVAGRDRVPGLVDPDGYLWPSIEQVYASATLEEVEIEARAQIEMALSAGIDVTHLDSHMGTLQYNPAYFDVYHRLAVEYDLPLRMGSRSALEQMGGAGQWERLIADGILAPDSLIFENQPRGEDISDFWVDTVRNLRPGTVTELYIHAALPTDVMPHITGSWRTRAAEYDLFTNDAGFKALIGDEGVVLIGYRELRDAQRRLRDERER